MTRMDWKQLHDSTLRGLVFDWALGSLVVELEVGEPPEVWSVRAEQTRLLTCPRLRPWGVSPHAFILEVREPVRAEAGHERLELHMASGDVIVVEAEKIGLNRR